MRQLCAILFAAAVAWGSTPVSVDQFAATVRESLRRREPDAHLAGAIRKMHLAERLQLRVVEQLESEGAGPKSVAAMEILADESASLPAAPLEPVPGAPPAPSAAAALAVLTGAGRNALNYAATLPDFLCTETVRRLEDFTGRPKQEWRLKDTLTLKLSYVSHAENYQLVEVNGRATSRDYEEVGGAVSQGEFGSLLISIFRGAPRSRFHWDHWTNLRKRSTHVFSFRIGLDESTYNVQFASSLRSRMSTAAGQHGFIYVDDETRRVVRIYAEADSIPAGFPVTNVSTLLDYDFVTVGNRPFLLPIRALVRMGTSQIQTRNEVQFTGYRKFAGEASITFDVDEIKKPR